MRVRCYEIDDSNKLVAAERERVVERWRAGDGPFWVDVESDDRGVWRDVLADFGLEALLIDELVHSGHAARVLPLDELLFFDLPTRVGEDPLGLLSASFACLDRLVVTLRGAPVEGEEPIVGGLTSKITLRERSAAALVSALLIELSVELRHRLARLREEAVVVSRRMDADPDTVALREILALKRASIDLDAVAEERAAVMELLEPLEHPFLNFTDVADQFRVALGNTVATERRLDRLDRRVADLQLRYDFHQQEETNRRLSRLTVISAIFLPLTLIAGIYGMNFDNMPELHQPLAYFVVLGGMVVLTVGMLLWFRARGWME